MINTLFVQFIIKLTNRLLSKENTIEQIHNQKRISKHIILAVWNELEARNKPFFHAYNIRARIREHVIMSQYIEKIFAQN